MKYILAGGFLLLALIGAAMALRHWLSPTAPHEVHEPIAPSPRAIPRWDDEGGALPDGPALEVPSGVTVE